jgi:hypothetical protein
MNTVNIDRHRNERICAAISHLHGLFGFVYLPRNV